MGIDEVLDGQRREFRDGRLDLVVEWAELAVHHDDAVAANGDRDVSTLASHGEVKVKGAIESYMRKSPVFVGIRGLSPIA
jgi:hypothetical protein